MKKLVNRGFTLIETIVAMLIISIAALAMASALGFAFARSSDGLLEAKLVYIAQGYLEEIQSRRYDESTPVGGTPPCQPLTSSCGSLGPESETRDTFDDVDDYHGLVESPPRDGQNQPLTQFNGFSAAVTVAYATAGQITDWGLDDTTDAKIVTVTIAAPGGEVRSFPLIRGNF